MSNGSGCLEINYTYKTQIGQLNYIIMDNIPLSIWYDLYLIDVFTNIILVWVFQVVHFLNNNNFLKAGSDKFAQFNELTWEMGHTQSTMQLSLITVRLLILRQYKVISLHYHFSKHWFFPILYNQKCILTYSLSTHTIS